MGSFLWGGGGFVVPTLLFILATCSYATKIAPRHCHNQIKHLHLAVGQDPTTSMTISFASKWAFPDIDPPLAGIYIGASEDNLTRFVPEQEYPSTYEIDAMNNGAAAGQKYYAPYQHHITIDGLEPDTTYYYLVVTGSRENYEKPEDLGERNHHHPSVQVENIEAENKIMNEAEEDREGLDDDQRRTLLVETYVDVGPQWDQHGRRLAPGPYDPADNPCIDPNKVRSFKTAPAKETDKNYYPMVFGIIGDIGQFEHSIETLEHMKHHLKNIQAVVLVGDIAYPGMDGRKWDTFFDFLDDHSVFDTIPLQIAAGNHDIDKQPQRDEIFLAYEHRFRMPRVHPPELGVFNGNDDDFGVQEDGALNMDTPPYPLPYEWGNAYYAFTYGPARHVIVNAYSDMSPGSIQYTWLQKELASVDRKRTPWLLLSIHVPIYNTFALHHHDLQIFAAREHLEPLFVKYNVNIVMNGHIHAYQRTEYVAFNETTPTGPMHITIGAGGRAADAPFQNEEPEPWIATRDASMYGYGRLNIMNETHAEWKWIPLSHSDKHDYNQVKGQDDMHLPALDHDLIMIENQYHVRMRELRRKRRLHKSSMQ